MKLLLCVLASAAHVIASDEKPSKRGPSPEERPEQPLGRVGIQSGGSRAVTFTEISWLESSKRGELSSIVFSLSPCHTVTLEI